MHGTLTLSTYCHAQIVAITLEILSPSSSCYPLPTPQSPFGKPRLLE
uniref:Uncharacterized protein n=1 Tax=Rhizophora mucronata TaxID=61149 RepID=A0A2P2QS04_RHIMU